MLEDESSIRGVFKEHQPNLVVHLAAQAVAELALSHERVKQMKSMARPVAVQHFDVQKVVNQHLILYSCQ